MENYFKKIQDTAKRIGKIGILSGTIAVSPQLESSPAPFTHPTESIESRVSSGLNSIEKEFEAVSTKQSESLPNSYAIISESQILKNEQFPSDSLLSDRSIASNLETGLAGNDQINGIFLSRDDQSLSGISSEKKLEDQGVTDETVKFENLYTKPEKYIIVSRKIENDSLVFVAKILNPITKDSQDVRVSNKLSDVLFSPEIQDTMMTQLTDLVSKKISTTK